MVQIGVVSSKRALAIGTGRGREPRLALQGGGAPQRERVRPAPSQQPVEDIAHRNRTPRRVAIIRASIPSRAARKRCSP